MQAQLLKLLNKKIPPPWKQTEVRRSQSTPRTSTTTKPPEDPPTLPATTSHYPSSFNHIVVCQNRTYQHSRATPYNGLHSGTHSTQLSTLIQSSVTYKNLVTSKLNQQGKQQELLLGLLSLMLNYTKAVQLLKERFGNASKVINAHMQSLLDLPNPNNCMSGSFNNLESLS